MLKKFAAEHSEHLTDLRGGATHQFRKAWERNALGPVAWEDSHRAQTHLTLPRIWCKPWNLLGGLWPIFKLVKLRCCKIYLFRPTSGFSSLWLPLLIRTHQRMRDYKVWLSVEFRNTNHINSFYGKFPMQEKSFISLWLGSIMVLMQHTLDWGNSLKISLSKQTQESAGWCVWAFMQPSMITNTNETKISTYISFWFAFGLTARLSAALPRVDQTWTRTWRTCPKVFDLPTYRHFRKVWDSLKTVYLFVVATC